MVLFTSPSSFSWLKLRLVPKMKDTADKTRGGQEQDSRLVTI